MGWIGQISSLEELEALMCGNVLPENDMPEFFYMYERRMTPDARRLIMYQCLIHREYYRG